MQPYLDRFYVKAKTVTLEVKNYKVLHVIKVKVNFLYCWYVLQKVVQQYQDV